MIGLVALALLAQDGWTKVDIAAAPTDQVFAELERDCIKPDLDPAAVRAAAESSTFEFREEVVNDGFGFQKSRWNSKTGILQFTDVRANPGFGMPQCAMTLRATDAMTREQWMERIKPLIAMTGATDIRTGSSPNSVYIEWDKAPGESRELWVTILQDGPSFGAFVALQKWNTVGKAVRANIMNKCQAGEAADVPKALCEGFLKTVPAK